MWIAIVEDDHAQHTMVAAQRAEIAWAEDGNGEIPLALQVARATKLVSVLVGVEDDGDALLRNETNQSLAKPIGRRSMGRRQDMGRLALNVGCRSRRIATWAAGGRDLALRWIESWVNLSRATHQRLAGGVKRRDLTT